MQPTLEKGDLGNFKAMPTPKPQAKPMNLGFPGAWASCALVLTGLQVIPPCMAVKASHRARSSHSAPEESAAQRTRYLPEDMRYTVAPGYESSSRVLSPKPTHGTCGDASSRFTIQVLDWHLCWSRQVAIDPFDFDQRACMGTPLPSPDFYQTQRAKSF